MNDSIMYREILQEPQALKQCLADNAAAIAELADAIREKNPACIVFAARGTSCNAAKFAKYLFETHAGIPVLIAAPSVLTKYGGKLDLSRAVVIGISQSGAAKDVCSLIDRGNENGALTVAVTNTEASLLERHAKFSLSCRAGEELSLAATKTFVTQMALVTALAARVSGDETLTALLDQLPRAAADVIRLAPGIARLATRYRFMNDCFILTRGVNYPVSLEFEIKMQETSFVRAHAFSVANFTHGPVAILRDFIPVIALATDEATDGDTCRMIKRVRKTGCEVLAITNKPAIAQLAGGNALLLPAWCEGAAGAFACATAAQIFSCELAVQRGMNPDAPAGLTKVTVTV